jgi:hypothetical protein
MGRLWWIPVRRDIAVRSASDTPLQSKGEASCGNPLFSGIAFHLVLLARHSNFCMYLLL